MTEPRRRPPHAAAHALFRICTSGIFIVAGLGHLLHADRMAARLGAARLAYLATWLAPARTLVVLAGVPLLAGGLALLVGWRVRAAAVVLIAVLVPITITVQLGGAETVGPLFKNIAILGSLILLASHGSDAWSLDGRRARVAGEVAS